jgi:two-component system response regulator HydG
MSQPRILIVHPDPSSLTLLSSMLRSLGHSIDEAPNDRVAVRQMERGGIHMVLAAVEPSDPDALELLTYMRRKHRQVPVILLFPEPNPDRTKEALRMGALSVLRYPVPATELRAAVTQALGTITMPEAAPAVANHVTAGNLPSRNTSAGEGLGDAASAAFTFGMAKRPGTISSATKGTRGDKVAREHGVVGNDPSLRSAFEMGRTIAPTRTPVLIVGEPGTGKALLARTIHNLGSRTDQPYVAVDCAALAHAMAEGQPAHGRTEGDRLAGSESNFDWSGKVAQAQGGTLFLDDISALPERLQRLLLEALEDREDDAQSPHQANARILMSTGENLAALVDQGRFRQDLYHRASVCSLRLPPLRHRVGDVEQLAEHFRARFSLEFGKSVVGFTADALEVLSKHDWPGNVRELEGVIQRGVALCQGTRITSGHLAPSLAPARSSRTHAHAARAQVEHNIRPLKEALEEPEKRIIIQALQALNWNRQETARVLDINRTTLYKKMKKYGLLVDEPAWVN